MRFIPSRAAAPRGPPITDFVSLRVRKICSRSASSRVVASLAAIIASDLFRCINSASGGCSSEPLEIMTARSIKFSSSRTLPGQLYSDNDFMAAAGIVSICFFIRRANSCAK